MSTLTVSARKPAGEPPSFIPACSTNDTVSTSAGREPSWSEAWDEVNAELDAIEAESQATWGDGFETRPALPGRLGF